MTMQPLKSSNIDGVEHLDGDLLRVRFKNGAVYEYSGVSAAEFAELVSAPSAGSYFAANIRNAKPTRRIPEEAPGEQPDVGKLDGEFPPYDTSGAP